MSCLWLSLIILTLSQCSPPPWPSHSPLLLFICATVINWSSSKLRNITCSQCLQYAHSQTLTHSETHPTNSFTVSHSHTFNLSRQPLPQDEKAHINIFTNTQTVYTFSLQCTAHQYQKSTITIRITNHEKHHDNHFLLSLSLSYSQAHKQIFIST